MMALAGLFDLVPRWVWASLVAAFAATSCKLTVDLGAVKLELEKARVAVAERDVAIANANTEAARKTAALQSAVTKAQNDARTREIDLRAVAAAAVSESDGLRIDAENLRQQLAGASAASAIERAATVATVLSQCAAKHQVLAERCDRHVNDVRTLIEAWPK